MSELQWHKSFLECREQFREVGTRSPLYCIACFPSTPDDPPRPRTYHREVFRALDRETSSLLQVFGVDATWQTFLRIAQVAFGCVQTAPGPIHRRAFDFDLPMCGDGDVENWVHLVLDLAVRKVHEPSLHADRLAWKENLFVKLAELSAKRREIIDKKISHYHLDLLPDGDRYFVELEDLANSSFAAIDILLSQATNSPAPETTRRDDVHSVVVSDGLESMPAADVNADASHPPSAEPASDSRAPKKPKRSTEKGEARDKLIAALTMHHKYADGGCLKLEPIGNNELARLAGVDQSTASAFFTRNFGGHRKYKATCADASRLVPALKLLNNEFAPHHLYGSKPADEDDHGEE